MIIIVGKAQNLRVKHKSKSSKFKVQWSKDKIV